MRLVTWNIRWCCGLDGVVDPARTVAQLHALGDNDVLCLQGVAVNYPSLTGHADDQLAQLRAQLPGWQLFFGAAVDEFTAAGRQQFGNVIATRLPVLQVQHFALPYPSDMGARSMPRMCTQVTVQDPVLGPVRVMTAQLEYFSQRQRLSQTRFLRRLHMEALAQAFASPQPCDDGSPFQDKPHTVHAVLCGDLGFAPDAPDYQALPKPAQVIECLEAGWAEQIVGAQWNDAWQQLHPDAPQPPTFACHDRSFSATPVAHDYVWVSDSLTEQVRSFTVDGQTQCLDHQPVRVVLGR